MERTEYREQFFAHAHQDPYMHALLRLWGDAWVAGYEQAVKAFVEQLKAAGEEKAAMDTWDYWHSKSRAEWRDEALAILTDKQAKSEAEFMVALAAMGPKFADSEWLNPRSTRS